METVKRASQGQPCLGVALRPPMHCGDFRLLWPPSNGAILRDCGVLGDGSWLVGVCQCHKGQVLEGSSQPVFPFLYPISFSAFATPPAALTEPLCHAL